MTAEIQRDDENIIPLCQKCGRKMGFARIVPVGFSFEKHVFECAECDQTEGVIIKIWPTPSLLDV